MPKQKEIERQESFLLLITANAEAKKEPQKMAALINEIHQDYMGRYGHLSRTIPFTDVALIGPYDFAILFTGTHEASLDLSLLIAQKGKGMFETITMPAIPLDIFLKMAKSK